MNGHQKQREQSGRMIEEALFRLMGEKSYGQITVSELVKRADVSRRTFYRLYSEKDAVLRGFFARLCFQYRREFPALERYDIHQIAGDYFGFWYQYREILLLLHKSGMEGLEYFADYSAGGFLMLLWRWILEGMEDPPRQYAEKVSQALVKFTGAKER